MNTYLYQRIHSPFFVLVYIGIHDGISNTSDTRFCGVSAVDYACGVCAVNVAIGSCCCCFHGATCVDFTIAGAVDGSIDGVARIVMCFRLNDSVYATNATTMFALPASTLLVVFSMSTWGTDSTTVSMLVVEALCFGFLVGLHMILWF